MVVGRTAVVVRLAVVVEPAVAFESIVTVLWQPVLVSCLACRKRKVRS